MEETLEQLIQDRIKFERGKDSLARRVKEYSSYLLVPNSLAVLAAAANAVYLNFSHSGAVQFYNYCEHWAEKFSSLSGTEVLPETVCLVSASAMVVGCNFAMRLLEPFIKRPNRYDVGRIARTISWFLHLRKLPLLGWLYPEMPTEASVLRRMGAAEDLRNFLAGVYSNNLSKSNFSVKEIPGSVHNIYMVKTYSDEGSAGFDFALKQGSSSLLKEYRRLEVLDELCHSISLTPFPVEISGKEDDYKLITALVRGRTLLQDINKAPRNDVVKAIASLAVLHNILYENRERFEKEELIGNVDYALGLDKVFISRIPESLRADAKEETKFLIDYLTEQPQKPIHGDFHPGNIIDPRKTDSHLSLSYEYDYDVILDYERMSNGAWEMDISNLVDFCQYNFSYQEKLQLLRLHCELTKDDSSFEEKERRFLYSSLFKNMHMCGTLSLKLRQMESMDGNTKCWNTYIAQAIDVANIMAEKGHIALKKNYRLTKLLNELRK